MNFSNSGESKKGYELLAKSIKEETHALYSLNEDQTKTLLCTVSGSMKKAKAKARKYLKSGIACVQIK